MKSLFRAALLSLTLLPFSAMAEEPVNINTADQEALESVTGIGPARAGAIIEFREDNGEFGSVDELIYVSGIGEATVDQLREQITAE